MRKILLATAAGFAAFVADGVAPARAQAGTDVTGQAAPTPGITARFTGRYRMYMGYVDQDGTTQPATAPAAGDNKLSNWDFIDYARLFPGFDGVAANGLRYGASLEIRMRTGGDARGDTRSGLFFRRIWGYVGTPTLGQIRVGSGPTGAVETMTVGHITGFGSGGWDGDAPAFIVGLNPSDNFWFSSSTRNNYTKIGYFSPQFFGFDFGLSYGTNNGNFGGDGACSFANISGSPGNCDRLSATANGSGIYNLRNIVEAMLRYRGTFGPVGVAVSGGWSGNLTSVDNSSTLGLAATDYRQKKLSMFVGGATVSFAGVTVGGLLTGGQGNIGSHSFAANGGVQNTLTGAGGLQPLLSGTGLNTSNFFGWEIGAQYTFGPFVVGAHYFNSSTEGNQAVAADRDRQGVAVGGTWNIAPGLAMFLEYLWGEVKENGVNLITGAPGTANNKLNVNLVSLGISFQW
jgi:predicted porin